ncbi:MAG: queuine tRNA-ribosyltransferase [Myxococcales bacterium]|nr:queuine tRNA-ribosyltransferase [Myxococcales bacterium]
MSEARGHEVVRTRGGALAMRSLEAGEVMHPGVGPLAEAEALYVRQSRLAERLGARASAELVLFDIGLGAGSNALCARATAEAAPADAARLHLVSFERDLGALNLALGYGETFGLLGEPALAARALLGGGSHESEHTRWELRHGDVLQTLAREWTRADIVFWDPFSPRANPSLWTIAAFRAMRRAAGPRCTLVTYSASTATRVALLLAGWAVGVGDAIGEKAQTTFAAVDLADVARPLDRRWPERLLRPDAPLPADAPPDTAALVARLPQFASDRQ